MPNFTAIATGAAANAATVNSPLSQLDTAIGTLASLTTTDKDSLVEAINEVKATDAAMVGDLGALLTTVDTSVVGAINEIFGKTLTHGIYVTAEQLKAWVQAEAYEITAVTYDSVYTLTMASATVKWPDGSGGTLTVTTINPLYESVDAFTITHTVSSNTVTQAAVTRNGDGSVTAKPALTV